MISLGKIKIQIAVAWTNANWYCARYGNQEIKNLVLWAILDKSLDDVEE